MGTSPPSNTDSDENREGQRPGTPQPQPNANSVSGMTRKGRHAGSCREDWKTCGMSWAPKPFLNPVEGCRRKMIPLARVAPGRGISPSATAAAHHSEACNGRVQLYPRPACYICAEYPSGKPETPPRIRARHPCGPPYRRKPPRKNRRNTRRLQRQATHSFSGGWRTDGGPKRQGELTPVTPTLNFSQATAARARPATIGQTRRWATAKGRKCQLL